MEQTVTHTAANLVPLLIILAVVFGGLLVLALLLRARVRRDRNPAPVRRRGSPAELQSGDMLSVLGRAFQVEAVDELAADGGSLLWCVLRSDDGPGRTVLARDLSLAVHFPGHGPAPAGDGFPEQIERDEGSYQRQGEPAQLGQGLRLARYRGGDGRWLALEERSGQLTLWRGKEVPVEGVAVLEES